jgi:hypothetical protein
VKPNLVDYLCQKFAFSGPFRGDSQNFRCSKVLCPFSLAALRAAIFDQFRARICEEAGMSGERAGIYLPVAQGIRSACE